MPLVGFETTHSADERPQTYALDGAATGILVENHISEKPTAYTFRLHQRHIPQEHNVNSIRHGNHRPHKIS
jgi:hypothetical protein